MSKIKSRRQDTYDEKLVRLWKFSPDITGKGAYRWFKRQVNDSQTYSYSLDFSGSFLEKDPKLKVEDLMIADNDICVFEVKGA